MPTRPTTRPVAAPTAVAFPVRSRSRHTHATIAVAAAVLVFVNARAASLLAATSADTPALMWTTVPPAKSSAPSFASHPPDPHTQCASGSYTNVAQRTRNTT